MKLGIVHPSKYKRCKTCEIVVSNIKHNLCNKCYQKRKEKNRNIERSSTISEYFTRNNDNERGIRNLGYVDPVKYDRNVRLLTLNPRGFGPDNQEKIIMLKNSERRLQFDGVFFSSPDRAWNSKRRDDMKKKLKGIGRNIQINTSDTGIESSSNAGYLPGGTMSIVWNNLAELIVDTYNGDKLGRWSSITIGRENKLIELITIYRLVDSTEEGIMTTHAQYNEVLGSVNTAKYYRSKFLSDLTHYLRKSHEEKKVTDVIIMGDINEHVEDKNIVQFMNENGLSNIHKHVNEIKDNTLDNTFKYGTKCIDVVLCSYGLLEYISGCQIVECDEVILNDHRGYVVDLEIERYCQCKLSRYDNPKHASLNNTKKSHVDKFNEKVNELMESFNLKQHVVELQYIRGKDQFDIIDEMFTKIFSKARSAVEGPTRSIPFSQRKLEVSNKYLYWKLKVKHMQGKRINQQRMLRRQELGKVQDEVMNLNQAKEQLKIAEEKWNEFKSNEQRIKEEELLDQYDGFVEDGDTPEIKEKRQKAIKTVKEKLQRNDTFSYLTRMLGKPKNALNKLRIRDESMNRMKTCYEREEIEEELIQFNRKHFSKAKETRVYKNRIIKSLHNDEIRNKILDGTITRNEVQDDNVYEFLKLLSRHKGCEDNRKDLEPITLEEWKEVVKRCKRKSVSSVFSRRIYVVYKLVNSNDLFLEVLIMFYNLVLQKGIVLKRWENILDVILEKGKGPELGKLRIIELIEGDLQIMTRMFVGVRNDKNIENNERLSKYNFGSRKHYSIESALLEKRLLYDTSKYTSEPTIHLLSDLEACYDRQIPSLGGMVEEALGVSRKAIKVICDTVSRFKHFTCTGFGISKRSYGGLHDRLTGTGQGNMLSGAVCRDQSCLVFKQLERLKKGIELVLPLSLKKIRRTIIAYVDDADFYSNGKWCVEKIQAIIDLYVRLYEATGAKIQEEKVKFYGWCYKMEDGIRVIEQITAEIKVHEMKITQIDISESTRTLGVHVTPSLQWKTQFEVLRKKVVEAMGKVMNTYLTYQQTGMYYNLYMLTNVYFGCGIIKLHEREEAELQRLYEPTILKKLGFSVNFPRKVMYVAKEMLGLGLFLPSTMIAIQRLKLFLGNKRGKTNAARMINALEEYMWVEGGLNRFTINDLEESYWTESWIDEVKETMKQRNIVLHSSEPEVFKITNNKSIMAYAREYVKEKKLRTSELQLINHVRLHKRVFLPFELLGQSGIDQTHAFRNNQEISQIKWTFYQQQVEQPSRKAYRRWRQFLQWLEKKRVKTVFDFDEDAVWKWQISRDGGVLLILEDESNRAFVKTNQNKFEEIEWNEQLKNGDYAGIVGYLYSDGTLKIQFAQNQNKIPKYPAIECMLSDKEFYMRDCILHESAYAACDGSKKHNCFGGYCVLTDCSKSQSVRWTCSSNKWDLNNVHSTEGYPFVMLLELIYKVSVGLRRGKIIIYMDRKSLINDMTSDVKKASEFTKDCGAIRCRFEEIKERLNITIIVKYSSKETKPFEEFKDNRGGFLMLECDEQSKLIRKRMETLNEDNVNIKYLGNHAISVNNVPCDRGIKEMIRIIDSDRVAEQVCKQKFKHYHQLVDLQARKQFHGATRSAVKCMVGFNHYGIRHNEINLNISSTQCPRCGCNETWEHVITCRTLSDYNEKFIKEVEKKIQKIARTDQQKQLTRNVMSDMRRFLVNLSNNYSTNQKIIGWEQAFRGYVVKEWNSMCRDKYFNAEMNRIIVKACTVHYMDCWRDRNEQFHEPRKQREYVIKWSKDLEIKILQSNKIEAIRCLRNNKINYETTSIAGMHRRNRHLMSVFKASKNETNNGDMRSYMRMHDDNE